MRNLRTLVCLSKPLSVPKPRTAARELCPKHQKLDDLYDVTASNCEACHELRRQIDDAFHDHEFSPFDMPFFFSQAVVMYEHHLTGFCLCYDCAWYMEAVLYYGMTDADLPLYDHRLHVDEPYETKILDTASANPDEMELPMFDTSEADNHAARKAAGSRRRKLTALRHKRHAKMEYKRLVRVYVIERDAETATSRVVEKGDHLKPAHCSYRSKTVKPSVAEPPGRFVATESVRRRRDRQALKVELDALK